MTDQRQMTVSELRQVLVAYKREARYFTTIAPDGERAAFYTQRVEDAQAALDTALKAEQVEGHGQ